MALSELRAIDFECARKEMTGWVVQTPAGRGIIERIDVDEATPVSHRDIKVFVRFGEQNLQPFKPEEVRCVW